jgi:hypothetical protein
VLPRAVAASPEPATTRGISKLDYLPEAVAFSNACQSPNRNRQSLLWGHVSWTPTPDGMISIAVRKRGPNAHAIWLAWHLEIGFADAFTVAQIHSRMRPLSVSLVQSTVELCSHYPF